jgi:hypothetical protein
LQKEAFSHHTAILRSPLNKLHREPEGEGEAEIEMRFAPLPPLDPAVLPCWNNQML